MTTPSPSAASSDKKRLFWLLLVTAFFVILGLTAYVFGGSTPTKSAADQGSMMGGHTAAGTSASPTPSDSASPSASPSETNESPEVSDSPSQSASDSHSSSPRTRASSSPHPSATSHRPATRTSPTPKRTTKAPVAVVKPQPKPVAKPQIQASLKESTCDTQYASGKKGYLLRAENLTPGMLWTMTATYPGGTRYTNFKDTIDHASGTADAFGTADFIWDCTIGVNGASDPPGTYTATFMQAGHVADSVGFTIP